MKVMATENGSAESVKWRRNGGRRKIDMKPASLLNKHGKMLSAAIYICLHLLYYSQEKKNRRK
jgi:hypothetical protein